jgi:hypothetical protein
MNNFKALEYRSARYFLLNACAVALTVAFTASLPQTARAGNGNVTPPPVPAAIEVPEGNVAFLEGHAVGTMNYVCLPCAISTTCPLGFAFSLFTPEATLSKDNDKQIITHFFSPNPDEGGKVRPTWQDSKDTSTVWGGDATPSSDPDFVAPGAVPWLRLPEAGVQEGPTGGKTLTATTFIQRLNTSGGVAPSSDCTSSTDVGKKAFVPYTANYFFYTTAP